MEIGEQVRGDATLQISPITQPARSNYISGSSDLCRNSEADTGTRNGPESRIRIRENLRS